MYLSLSQNKFTQPFHSTLFIFILITQLLFNMAFNPTEYIAASVIKLKAPAIIDNLDDGRFMFWHDGGLKNESTSDLFDGTDIWYDKVPMENQLQFDDKFGNVYIGQKIRLMIVLINSSEIDPIKDLEISV